MPLAALTIAIACYIALWPIRFRNCRMQNSDARLVFEESNFCHITPLLRAPPPHFYTFEAPSSPLPHFYRLPPPTPHFYCFPSNTTTTFHCSPPTSTHKHTHTISTILLFSVHNFNTCTSFVFPPLSSPPPHFYCFSSTASNTFLWFLIRYIHHISIVSLHHYLHHIPIVFHPPPRPPFCCFPSSTLTTLLWFFLHHLHHISIVFLFPLHQYQISKLPPPEPPPSNFYVFFISMLTHQNEEKNRFGQRRARE